MQFVFQSLTWGFLLVLLPLLIHLINLLRYRRQRWAAMQFLLESYKRHRRWVWLKQALLLLSRMAVLAVLVAMLAQWVSGARLLSLLGQSVTHHYVLLDDSMSMGQSFRDGTLFERGIRSVTNLLDREVQDGGAHQVSIIRFSRAALQAPSTEQTTPRETDVATQVEDNSARNVDAIADLMSRSVIGKSDSLFESLASQGVVDVDVDGVAAIQLANSLITNAGSNENATVYYVSDFRDKEWEQPTDIKTALQGLEKQESRIELIDCADASVENISLLTLEPDQEVLAAGVPVILRLSLRNQGLNPLRNVAVRITSYNFNDSQLNIAFDQFSSGAATELPAIVIEKLDPNETVSRSVQVVFPNSGSHIVKAAVADDALKADNQLACVLNLVDAQRLLLVDDSAERLTARFLQAALDPGGTTKTGWKVSTESSSYLRDSQIESLQDYAAIMLTNVNSLDERAVRNLRQYVSNGGGLAVFPGAAWSSSDAQRMTQLLGDIPPNSSGADSNLPTISLLPYALASVEEVTPRSETETVQTLVVENHPIFSPLLSLASSPFQFVRFSKYVRVRELDANNTQAVDSRSNPVKVIARLGNRIPLMVDHKYGDGHVVLFTSAVDPSWNSWSQDPTFVVVMLKLSGYLASFQRSPTSQPVASGITHAFSPQEFLPDVELVLPNRAGASRQSIQLNARAVDDRNLVVRWNPLDSLQAESDERFLFGGARELWLSSLSGGRKVINFPANAPAREGELQRTPKTDLLERLSPLKVNYRTADAALDSSPFSSGSSQQTWLLGLLIVLLLIEQALAYSASYHLPQRSATPTPGVAS